MSTEEKKELAIDWQSSAEESSSEKPVSGGRPDTDPSDRDASDSIPPDLEAQAIAAAEAAISEGEGAVQGLQPEAHAGTDRHKPGMSRNRERVLRGMLLLNVALMGVLLLIPNPATEGETEPEPQTSHTPVEIPPVSSPVTTPDPQPGGDRPNVQRVGNNQLWERAFLLFGEGSYDEAADFLLEYERRNPNMPEGQKLDLYTLLGTCLFKAGRMEQAALYRARSRTLVDRGYLPEDLRNAARKAWEEGRGEEARRYYARFLLQQKQLPPALRGSVTEAYLRIGDAYRMAADLGAGSSGSRSWNDELAEIRNRGRERKK